MSGGFATLNFGFVPDGDNEIASFLRNTSTLVQINESGPPVAGQVLVATGADKAIWSDTPENQSLEEVLNVGNATGANDIIVQQKLTMSPVPQPQNTLNLLSVSVIEGTPLSTALDGVIEGSYVFDRVGKAMYYFDGDVWVQMFDILNNVPNLQQVSDSGNTTTTAINVQATLTADEVRTNQLRPQTGNTIAVANNLAATGDVSANAFTSPDATIKVRKPISSFTPGDDVIIDDDLTITGTLNVQGTIFTDGNGCIQFNDCARMPQGVPQGTTSVFTLTGINGAGPPTSDAGDGILGGSLAWGGDDRFYLFNGATWERVGTVVSVGLTAPPEFVVGNSPITSSGNITLTKATQAANTVYSGPAAGPAQQPTFRQLTSADIPAGVGSQNLAQVLIEGNTSGANPINITDGQELQYDERKALINNRPEFPLEYTVAALDTIQFGQFTQARNNFGVAVGNFCWANGVSSASFGNSARAIAQESCALGVNAEVDNVAYTGSTAVGYNSRCTKNNQVGISNPIGETLVRGTLVVDNNATHNGDVLITTQNAVLQATDVLDINQTGTYAITATDIYEHNTIQRRGLTGNITDNVPDLVNSTELPALTHKIMTLVNDTDYEWTIGQTAGTPSGRNYVMLPPGEQINNNPGTFNFIALPVRSTSVFRVEWEGTSINRWVCLSIARTTDLSPIIPTLQQVSNAGATTTNTLVVNGLTFGPGTINGGNGVVADWSFNNIVVNRSLLYFNVFPPTIASDANCTATLVAPSANNCGTINLTGITNVPGEQFNAEIQFGLPFPIDSNVSVVISAKGSARFYDYNMFVLSSSNTNFFVQGIQPGAITTTCAIDYHVCVIRPTI